MKRLLQFALPEAPSDNEVATAFNRNLPSPSVKGVSSSVDSATLLLSTVGDNPIMVLSSNPASMYITLSSTAIITNFCFKFSRIKFLWVVKTVKSLKKNPRTSLHGGTLARHTVVTYLCC